MSSICLVTYNLSENEHNKLKHNFVQVEKEYQKVEMNFCSRSLYFMNVYFMNVYNRGTKKAGLDEQVPIACCSQKVAYVVF